MKLINQLRDNGRHGVLLLVESTRDASLATAMFRAVESHPSLRAALIQETGDARPNLLLEELEEPKPREADPDGN